MIAAAKEEEFIIISTSLKKELDMKMLEILKNFGEAPNPEEEA